MLAGRLGRHDASGDSREQGRFGQGAKRFFQRFFGEAPETDSFHFSYEGKWASDVERAEHAIYRGFGAQWLQYSSGL